MSKLTLHDLHLKNQRVLMRVDFNVPLHKDGSISDDTRIQAALASIEYVLNHGASLLLISHLGRPKATPDPKYSLAPCAKRLAELLGKPVPLAPDCIGPKVEKMAHLLKPGELLMLENARFHPGEEEPETDPDFVKQLAKLGTIYVNDAFGTAHRAHASTALLAKYFPQKAAVGFLMEQELKYLTPLIENPKRPFCVIIGGAKVSTKAGIIQNLLKIADLLFIGGGMVFPFMKAKGISVGSSLLEAEDVKTAKHILSLSQSSKIILPRDLVIAHGFSNDAPFKIQSIDLAIPEGWMGMDIGPQTVLDWAEKLKSARSIFWNGPVGVFEMPHFAAGTKALAASLAEASGETIIGGGDSIAAIRQMGLSERFTHLSTGGGASLEFLEFGHLPGVDALSNR